MSDTYNDQFLENRYELYIELGHNPKDAEIMAREDLEHENYDHVPKEEDDEK
tara:strand:- start:308 stop:463 length:156 start_codon:yes stop_codon:yes gene_type:complete